MDKLRLARYHDKMQYILSSFGIVEQLLPDPDETQTNALYYLLLTAIESAMDIIAMLVKDLGRVPKGDQSNITTLHSLSIIKDETRNELFLCNGLRNVLVHQYNGIDRVIVLESVPRVTATLKILIDAAEGFLNADR